MQAELFADLAQLINHQQQSMVLVTLEADGRLRTACIPHPYLDEAGSMWFFVASKSPLVNHIEANPDVCVVGGPVSQAALMSLSGTGFVITHMAIKQKVLTNMRAALGLDTGAGTAYSDVASGEVVLVRVVIHHAEYRRNISDKPLRLLRSKPVSVDHAAVTQAGHFVRTH